MAQKSENVTRTRWSLIERLTNLEDQDSWRDFFAIYGSLIHKAAVNAGCTHAEADDVVQETVISVTRMIKDIKMGAEHGSFKGWLLRVTQRRIVDQLRKRKRGSHTEVPFHSTAETDELWMDHELAEKMERYWDREWEHHLWMEALDRVKKQASATQYQIFHLHVVKEHPLKTVRETLGVSATQVYLAKHRVSVMVKKELKRLGHSLSAPPSGENRG